MNNTINAQQDYCVVFSNDKGEIGRLDFNGPEMVFTGQADEAAKLFFNFVAESFAERMAQGRIDNPPAAQGVKINRDEKLLSAIRLMRAWFIPGGPAPNEKMPVKQNVLLAAELELERLYELLATQPIPAQPASTSELTIDELRSEIGRLQYRLQVKVCGDPAISISFPHASIAAPTQAEPKA